jgi:hypothetical protein
VFGNEEAEKYKVQCLQLFPYAIYFGSKAGLEQPKKATEESSERKPENHTDPAQQ